MLVGYNTLTFVKRDEVYDASYDVTLSIYDTLNSLVGEKVWTQEVKGISFDQSVSSTMYSLTQRVFSINPGKYSLSVTIRDNESRLSRRKTKALIVSEYATPQFALSDILLLSRLSEKGGVRSMAPSVSPNMGNISDS